MNFRIAFDTPPPPLFWILGGLSVVYNTDPGVFTITEQAHVMSHARRVVSCVALCFKITTWYRPLDDTRYQITAGLTRTSSDLPI